jgi:hypothetical protein
MKLLSKLKAIHQRTMICLSDRHAIPWQFSCNKYGLSVDIYEVRNSFTNFVYSSLFFVEITREEIAMQFFYSKLYRIKF